MENDCPRPIEILIKNEVHEDVPFELQESPIFIEESGLPKR